MDYFLQLGSYLNRLLDTILNLSSSFLPSPIFLAVVLIVLIFGAYYMLKN